MITKLLIKLIDYAIIPAITLVAAKVIGIIFLIQYYEIEYKTSNIKLLISNPDDFVLINTYSSFFMFFVVFAGVIWVLIKAHVFHDTHVTPTLSARLYEMDLEELISSTKVVFSQTFIWLSYLWLMTFMFGAQAYYGLSLYILFYISFLVSFIATVLIAIDINREISFDKNIMFKFDPKGKIVKYQKITEEVSK